MLFVGLAHTGSASAAIKNVADESSSETLTAQASAPNTLPVRNLQIEVRQVSAGSGQSSGVSTQGGVILSPGNSGGSVSVQAGSNARTGSRSLSQQALVLNGRSVNFSLGQTVPLRVVQSFVRNGVVNIIPSTVLIDRASGFSAQPVWAGGVIVDVEISAGLAQGKAVGGPQSSTSTTLQVPLNEWVTIAESADEQSGSASGILSGSRSQSASSLKVQMRLSVK